MLWRQDYITTHAAQNQQQNWAQFTASLEQSFAPAQQTHEAEQRLRRLKQRGRYIEEYISEFAVLASQAGLTDDTVALRAYFSEGLDPAIAHEALRSNPTTLDAWKTASRNAYRIVSEQARYRASSSYRSPTKGQRKGKGKGYKHGPRYQNIQSQPVLPQFRRSEFDMDIDYYYQSYNQINSYDSEEEEEFNEAEEEDESDDEISYTQPRRELNKGSEALHHLINNVLTDEQRAALKRGECFFCHKQGHFYRDCQARKTYIKSKGTKNMGSKPNRQSKPRSSNPKKKPFTKKKPVDPNAMVYNFEEDEEEFSDNEDF